MTQDCEAYKGVMAAPRSGGSNMGTRGCVPPILSYLMMKVRCLVIWKLNNCCICM